jgi:hypothetical protein
MTTQNVQPIRVIFLDPTASRQVEAEVAGHLQVGRLIPLVVAQLGLPTSGPDGVPIQYKLDHREGGRRLDDGQPLAESQVSDGDHLLVCPEMIAGAGPSPRMFRLQKEWERLQTLQSRGNCFACQVLEREPGGNPVSYQWTFRGPGIVASGHLGDCPKRVDQMDHQVHCQLDDSFPRSAPWLRWQTPIFHPNIAPNGMICLGGYSSHWTASLWLDQLCEMLWEMLVYRNISLESPYHQAAAKWAAQQSEFDFPLTPHRLANSLVAAGPMCQTNEPASGGPVHAVRFLASP